MTIVETQNTRLKYWFFDININILKYWYRYWYWFCFLGDIDLDIDIGIKKNIDLDIDLDLDFLGGKLLISILILKFLFWKILILILIQNLILSHLCCNSSIQSAGATGCKSDRVLFVANQRSKCLEGIGKMLFNVHVYCASRNSRDSSLRMLYL